MSRLFESVARELDAPGRTSRRIFVGRAGRWGAGLFAGIGALVAAPPARAFCRTVGCCTLEYCNDCASTTCKSCQNGSYWWGCVDQYHHLWTCYECDTGSCPGCSLAVFGTAPSP